MFVFGQCNFRRQAVLALAAGILFAGCSNPSSSASTPTPAPVVPGIAGSIGPTPGTWLNGTWNPVQLPAAATSGGVVNCVTKAGTAVYLGGMCYEASGCVPGYWQNGVWVPLPIPSGQTQGVVTALGTCGSQVIAAGYCDSPTAPVPGYWVNGLWTGLDLPPAANGTGQLTCLAVCDNTVYLGGPIGPSSVPGIWVDGNFTPLPLPSGNSNTSIVAVAASGGTVYAAGSCNGQPGIWINSFWVPEPIPPACTYGCPMGLLVNGTTVEVVGYCETSEAVYYPGYWADGVWVPLSVPAFYMTQTGLAAGGRAMAIGIFGQDIDVVGNVYNGGGAYPCYWHNGTWSPLSTVNLYESFATGLFLP